VRVFDTHAGEWKILDNSACAFSYRDSVFKKSFSLHQANRYLITSVRLTLAREAKVNIHYQALRDYFAQRMQTPDTITPRQVFQAVVDIRRSRLPDPAIIANAGSFFKNPIVPLAQYERLLKKFPALVSYPADASHRKLAAAWLIDQAGWRGVKEDHVAVHEQQALVLLNRGAASGAELLAFANKIRSGIQQRYGIDLEIEPTVI
jgi:UDP-N-acetylmuramate dehydrogenase